MMTDKELNEIIFNKMNEVLLVEKKIEEKNI